MSQYSGSSQVAKLVVVAALLHTINAFHIANISPRIPIVSSSTSLYMGAMNRRNKAADLAAKMAEAKKQRELAEAESGGETTIEDEGSSSKNLSAAEIKLRNDRQRFADMLDNSMSGGSGIDKGYYLTEQQENENADAVCKYILLLFILFGGVFIDCLVMVLDIFSCFSKSYIVWLEFVFSDCLIVDHINVLFVVLTIPSSLLIIYFS